MIPRSKKLIHYLLFWHFISFSVFRRFFQLLCIKYTAHWHSLCSICEDLLSSRILASSVCWLCSLHHFTLMLCIAWKVCCGKKPACKSCILNETCSRWAWALQSGLALIKYQLALLLYLISCHIHTLSEHVGEKLKWKLWPCSFIQFVARLHFEFWQGFEEGGSKTNWQWGLDTV